MKKVVTSLLCAAMFVTFIPMYSIQKLKGSFHSLLCIPARVNIPFPANRCFTCRRRFLGEHHGFPQDVVPDDSDHAGPLQVLPRVIFADAICNNSGLGFNGYDGNGEANWNLYSNVNVVGFEVALLNISERVSVSGAAETRDFSGRFGSAQP